MTTLLTIGANSYTGTVTIPPTTIPTGYTNFLVDIGCALWADPTSSAEVSLEISYDGGNTWMPWFSAMLYGGTLNRHGQPLSDALVGTTAPQGSSLLFQGTAVITGTLITSGITIVGS
ncbi:MAG: hypothetical protein ACLQBD_26660 [Syntrophobacteraceae bacterium]